MVSVSSEELLPIEQLVDDYLANKPVGEEDSERREADFIARAMVGLMDEEGRDPGDLAVLYRTHAQSRSIEEALR